MSRMGSIIPLLPNELLVHITESLSNNDCIALALSGVSGALEGYSSLYYAQRDNSILVVPYHCYFLAHPTLWKRFLKQHNISPLLITTFEATNCYWLPAEVLSDAIVAMVNLEDLAINGTQLSLSHLATIFGSCEKIIKLDFNFLNEELYGENGKIHRMGFARLTCLKMSTSALDVEDYFPNDPWSSIVMILAFCRDCTDLQIQVTYAGDYSIEPKCEEIRKFEEGRQQSIKNFWFPKLDWMANLKSLAIVKLGRIFNRNMSVHSLLLEDLIRHIFRDGGCPDSLQHLWVHGFGFEINVHLTMNLWGTTPQAPPMKSFYVGGHPVCLVDEIELEHRIDEELDHILNITPDPQFDQLQHLAVIHFQSNDEVDTVRRPHLRSMKHARLINMFHHKEVEYFLQTHPELEFLDLNYGIVHSSRFYFSHLSIKLLNLNVLVLQEVLVTTRVVDYFVDLCPNIEFLHLIVNTDYSIGVHDFTCERDGLSSIRFRNLSSLHIYGSSELDDGDSLLLMIQQCPKLRSLHISGPINAKRFFANFDRFLQSAVNLRDLRLGLQFGGNGVTLWRLLTSVFKSLSKLSPKLERIFLFDIDKKFPDYLRGAVLPPPSMVNFPSEMKHLVAFSVVSPLLQHNIFHARIMQQVSPPRPALWTHFGGRFPDRSDPDAIPAVHYNEMIEPAIYFVSPF